mgnify:CR=1 FL=1
MELRNPLSVAAHIAGMEPIEPGAVIEATGAMAESLQAQGWERTDKPKSKLWSNPSH